MGRHILCGCLVLAIGWGLAPRRAAGQAATIDSSLPPAPGGGGSTLGQAPGSGGGTFGNNPGANQSVLGGRPGNTAPRILPPTQPAGGPTELQAPISAPQPQPLQPFSAPLLGTLDLPAGPDDEGPPDGLTLDQAIGWMLKVNLDLRNKYMEIPQARADVLQAGLRANPVFYADGQLLPYRHFSRAVPGGPSQYDVNVSHPFDLSGKRHARRAVAVRALSVLEAQYQDAVRQRIDDLYSAYVDALAARQTVRYSRASVEGFTKLLERTRQLLERRQVARSDYAQVRIQLKTAQIGLYDAEESYRKAKRVLGALLNVPPDRALAIEPRGSILDLAPPPPPADDLRRIALTVRPDINSYRLGVGRAEADVRLARANRFADTYVLFQPYTWQDNAPYGLRSQISWALGVTVPMPLYNRNQGGIQRARLNVTQTRIQLADLERQAVVDVEQALREYLVSRRAVLDIQNELIPDARQVRDDALKLYLAGETSAVTYLNAQLGFNTVLKQYVDTLIRHRRSMLALNTAVGERVLP